MRLPIIVSMGGVNAAGRTSGHQSYRRMVIDALPEDEQARTLAGLAVSMGLVTTENGETFIAAEDEASLSLAEVAARYRDAVLAGTLVRRVEKSHFDVDALHWQSSALLNVDESGDGQAIQFTLKADQVPSPLPAGWQVAPLDEARVTVTAPGGAEVLLENTREFPVKAAGQLPRGFDMASLYNSRFQPRGLQMALFGATDPVVSSPIGAGPRTLLYDPEPCSPCFLRTCALPGHPCLEKIGVERVERLAQEGGGALGAPFAAHQGRLGRLG